MLLETIRCEAGIALHLSFHQKRLDQSLKILGIQKNYPLESLIIPPDDQLYRCRFLYDENHFEVEFHPYHPKKISTLKLTTCDTIDYPLKSADRRELNALFEQRHHCDDVLIVKNTLLSDTTIANIALFIEGKWLTPETPLLEGTTRARLLEEGFLSPAALGIEHITQATKIGVMNAMLGFIEVENGIIV